VPIQRELQYLKSYIELQKMRMNENLCLEVTMDEATQEQLIYPLLLLPLVENAFKYAGGDYWIKLEAKLTHNLLQFNISNAIPSLEMKAKKGGIGLENLQRRLALLYPNRHAFQVTKTDHCFAVTLKIDL
jgi:two-component system LytT family sensor kinase